MDETTRRPPRGARRGHDVHQTHFFYPDDLASGATVRDHVTGEVVGEVDSVGRHVFEGYGAPAPGGGTPGDLVVEVRELEALEPAPVPATGGAGGVDEEAADAEEPEESAEQQGPRWEHRERDQGEGDDGREKPAIGASVAQGVAIAVLAPLLALLVLVVVLVLLVG